MKKSILFAVAAVMLTAACSKQADSASSAGNGGFEMEAPVPVSFASNIGGVTTRSLGALDAWDGTEDLYFFGLERLKDASGADSLDLVRPFIDNVSRKAPAVAAGTQGTITLYNPAVGDGQTEPYYYGSGNYEFFGYYLDDAGSLDADDVPVIDKQEDAYFTHIAIDGTQDVLVGYADRDSVVNHKIETWPAISKDRLFSAYAIRKWEAKPEMLFKHKLSRFDFYIRSGEADAVGTISVAGISVESDTEADMIVAGSRIYEGLQNVANPAYLALKIKDADENLVLLDETNAIPAPDFDAADPVSVLIPGSLLVIPGQEKYKMQLTLTQNNASVPGGQPQPMVIDFSKIINGNGNTFAEAGYKYKITLVVYKYREVEILVSLDEWKEGGEIIMDPDAE